MGSQLQKLARSECMAVRWQPVKTAAGDSPVAWTGPKQTGKGSWPMLWVGSKGKSQLGTWCAMDSPWSSIPVNCHCSSTIQKNPLNWTAVGEMVGVVAVWMEAAVVAAVGEEVAVGRRHWLLQGVAWKV